MPGAYYVEGFSVSGDGFHFGYYEPSQEVRTTDGVCEELAKTWNQHTLSIVADIQHQYAEELTQHPTHPIINFDGPHTGGGVSPYRADGAQADLLTFVSSRCPSACPGHLFFIEPVSLHNVCNPACLPWPADAAYPLVLPRRIGFSCVASRGCCHPYRPT